jgi:hypothetical protein
MKCLSYVQCEVNLKNSILFYLFIALLLVVGFLLGHTYKSSAVAKHDFFIANTVGNNLSEVNRLYTLLGQQNNEYRKEQIKYNMDMLTLIDCGNFIKSIKLSTVNQDTPYLINGLQSVFRMLELAGIDQKKLVLCDGKVIQIASMSASPASKTTK